MSKYRLRDIQIIKQLNTCIFLLDLQLLQYGWTSTLSRFLGRVMLLLCLLLQLMLLCLLLLLLLQLHLLLIQLSLFVLR